MRVYFASMKFYIVGMLYWRVIVSVNKGVFSVARLKLNGSLGVSGRH